MTREFSQGLGQGNEQVPGVLTAPRPAAPATVAMPPGMRQELAVRSLLDVFVLIY